MYLRTFVYCSTTEAHYFVASEMNVPGKVFTKSLLLYIYIKNLPRMRTEEHEERAQSCAGSGGKENQ